MPRNLLLQLLLPFAFLFASVDRVDAQSLTYSAIVQELDSSAQLKALFVGVIDHLPNADVNYDRNSDLLTIVTDVQITFEELHAIVLAAGFELISLDVI